MLLKPIRNIGSSVTLCLLDVQKAYDRVWQAGSSVSWRNTTFLWRSWRTCNRGSRFERFKYVSTTPLPTRSRLWILIGLSPFGICVKHVRERCVLVHNVSWHAVFHVANETSILVSSKSVKNGVWRATNGTQNVPRNALLCQYTICYCIELLKLRFTVMGSSARPLLLSCNKKQRWFV